MGKDRNIVGDLDEEREVDQGKKSVNYSAIFIIVLLVSLLINGLSLYFYDRYMAPKIYVYDLKAFVRQQKQKFIKGEITEADFENNLKRLDFKIKTLPDNSIVITKDVVLKGGIELE